MVNKKNQKLLEENWINIQKRVIDPLWNFKFKSMYLSAKLDKDDFESLAHEELTKAFESYSSDDSSVITYAFNILSKKCLTELRNCTQRDKRKALHVATSLNAPAGEEKDIELGDTLEYPQEADGISLLTEKRVKNFINSLSNIQLRIMVLLLLDFDKSEISNMLEIPNNRFKDAFKELSSIKTIDILKRRVI